MRKHCTKAQVSLGSLELGKDTHLREPYVFIDEYDVFDIDD